MGNSASSLPYTIGKQVASANHGWMLHEGTQKSDGTSVSVFTARKPALSKTPVDRSNPHLMQLTPALHHYMNCKKLRHPYILSVYATLDTDHQNDPSTGAVVHSASMGSNMIAQAANEQGDLMIVTEPCIPLEHWLSTRPPPEQLAWGLECVVRALHFMHASANLSHGNVSPESFYVTPAGDVKLWNFSLATIVDATASGTSGLANVFLEYEALLTPLAYRSPERVKRRYQELAQSGGTHSVDSFSMGVLLQHFFQNSLPQPLVKAVQRMQTPNIRMRPRLQPLLKCPIFDTPYQKLQLQLETFAVLSVEEKIPFWQTMVPQMHAQLIPEQVVLYKLLPMMKSSLSTICSNSALKQQEVYRKEESYLDGSAFSKELGPIIGLLFQVNDRGIRGTLLQKANIMAENLDSQTLNQAVFEPMCSGFADSSAALRELTLKATLVLLPQLTHPNLEKLSRYLVRLQSDPEAAIRTNTIIYFGKLAPHLTDIGRSKLLLPAFVRAMKDPFTPCRLEALRFANNAKQYFDPADIAGKVLPALTPYLLDPSVDVRRECFQVVDDLLFIIRQEGEKMPTQAEAHINTPTYSVGSCPNNAAPPRASVPRNQSGAQAATASVPEPPQAPSSGGYLSGLSSWMTSTAKPSNAVDLPASLTQQPTDKSEDQRDFAPGASQQAGHALSHRVDHANHNGDGWDDGSDGGDGWGDDSESSFDKKESNVSGAVSATPAGTLFAQTVDPASEDDFFDSIGKKTTNKLPITNRATMSANKKGIVPIKAAISTKPTGKKLAVTKLTHNDGGIDDGWDDF